MDGSFPFLRRYVFNSSDRIFKSRHISITDSGTNYFVHISDLYLDEKSSDVTFHVDDVELPAHSNVLAQRCRYFAAMFENGLFEARPKRIEIRGTSIDGFKQVLKWIYTGTIEFMSIESTFDFYRLADMYELSELLTGAIYFLRGVCTFDNVCYILNRAVLLSLCGLKNFTISVVKKDPCKILKHESFKQLSPDALNEILTRVVFPAADIDIFHAVVGWMKANPSKSAGFFDVLKNVALDSITVKDMVALPPNVLDAVVHLIRQNKTSGLTYCLKDENVALPKYGVKVITGGETFKEKAEDIKAHTSSEVGNLKHFENPFSLSWFCLFQFIQLLLHLFQLIEMVVNYFEFIPLLILAIFSSSIDAPDRKITMTRKLSDGSSSIKKDSGILKHLIGTDKNGILIDLGHRFELNSFKMQLVNAGENTYSYCIDVSEDKDTWTRAIDHSKYSCRSLQNLYFAPRSVRFIRICGTAPVNDIFKISSFEAFYKV
uniref:BTB domain-containing protein n=1 Tax=Panagrellus redivivus TaxID=6233 RepID=A0A7E4UTT0_PANRE